MTAIINSAQNEFLKLTQNRMRIAVLSALCFAIMC